MARLVTGLATTLTIPVHREWKIARIHMIVIWTPTNAVVQPSQVCTFYLSIKSLERFSFEYRKTKTKVITLANHKGHRQYSEPIKTRSNYM